MTIKSEKEYLSGPAVMERFGISPITLVRWQKRDDLAFPKPLKIGMRNFWKISSLEAWEQSRMKAAA